MRSLAALAVALAPACDVAGLPPPGDGADDREIHFESFLARLVERGTCFTEGEGSETIACGTYVLTFVVGNIDGTRVPDRVERFEVRIGEQTIRSDALQCRGFPWTLPPGEQTELLDVRLASADDRALPYSIPSFVLEAGCEEGPAEVVLVPLAEAQASGELSLRVEGAFEGGDPFAYEATAAIEDETGS